MDIEKILQDLKADPAKLGKLADAVKKGDIEKALKEHGIDIEPEKIAELGKKLLSEGGELGKKITDEGGDLLEKGEAFLKSGEGKELLEKGEALLGNLFGGKK